MEALEPALAEAKAEQEKLKEEWFYRGDKEYDAHEAKKAAVAAAVADLTARIDDAIPTAATPSWSTARPPPAATRRRPSRRPTRSTR